MYKNQYISELPINEVKEYFDKLRCNTPWTAEQFADFEMCKERLTVYACKTLEQANLLDKISAEVCEIDDEIVLNPDSFYERKAYVRFSEVINIIDKHRKESEAAE